MTARHTSADVLRASLADLRLARDHLQFSFDRIRHVAEPPANWTAEELERMEAFTGRFARVVDLLTNTVLRALFRVELEPEGTPLDRLDLAEKRGFVDRAEELRLLKEQRNVIAHDYAGKAHDRVFKFCRDRTPTLEAICDRVASYADARLAAVADDSRDSPPVSRQPGT